MGASQTTELIRRIENLVRIGTVAQVDLDGAMVRVKIEAQDEDDTTLLTNWLRWQSVRAGGVRVWSAPSVGEQCTVLSPGGDLAAGIVMPAIYSDNIPPPDTSADTLVVDAPQTGGITLRCGDSSLVITNSGVQISAPRIDLNT